jgi:hypothetical protein
MEEKEKENEDEEELIKRYGEPPFYNDWKRWLEEAKEKES